MIWNELEVTVVDRSTDQDSDQDSDQDNSSVERQKYRKKMSVSKRHSFYHPIENFFEKQLVLSLQYL